MCQLPADRLIDLTADENLVSLRITDGDELPPRSRTRRRQIRAQHLWLSRECPLRHLQSGQEQLSRNRNASQTRLYRHHRPHFLHLWYRCQMAFYRFPRCLLHCLHCLASPRREPLRRRRLQWRVGEHTSNAERRDSLPSKRQGFSLLFPVLSASASGAV